MKIPKERVRLLGKVLPISLRVSHLIHSGLIAITLVFVSPNASISRYLRCGWCFSESDGRSVSERGNV